MAFRFLRTRLATVGFLCLLLAPLLIPQQATAQTRQWTDKNGDRTSASFVRISGNKVVLKRGRRIIQVPLSDLSQEDRDYIDGLKKSNTRNWTVNGRKLRGKFREYNDGHATIDLGSRTREIPLPSLSDEDQDHIRGLLKENGKLDKLSDTDPLKASAFPGLERGVVEHQTRTWTNDKGKEVEATFVRIDGENVILRRSSDGKELPVPLAKLSRLDQSYASAQSMRAKLAAASTQQPSFPRNVPRMPRPTAPRSGGIGAFPGQPGGGAASSHMDTIKRMREQQQERQLAAQQRREEEATRRAAESQARDEQQRIDREERDRRQREALASMNHDAVESTTYAPPPNTSSHLNSGSESTMEYVYVCSECDAELPSHIGAGDRCPNCRILIAFEENVDGTRTYAKNGGGAGAWKVPPRGVIRIGVLILFGIAGLITRMLRSDR